MTDLSGRYLGLDLPHPVMVGASPMVDDLGLVRRLEDAGAAAIVMRSLFEEEVEAEQEMSARVREEPADSFAEALSYLPEAAATVFGPDEYLEQVRRVGEAVDIPVVASLNGTRSGRWLDWASKLGQAGAAALELNVYRPVTAMDTTAERVEAEVVRMVEEVVGRTTLPIAVKLSPFYTAFAAFAHRVEVAGAAGLVLFNRFFQPEVDPDTGDVRRSLPLSHRGELPLRLRWLAILSGRFRGSLAATGGVHDGFGVVQACLCGAHAVQVVSPLLRHGPEHLATILAEVSSWLEEHEIAGLDEVRGALSLERCPDPAAYERVNYVRLLHRFDVEEPIFRETGR
ncbi:MAG: dihydroorotate dehydrogenase-like protein [Acidobacteria bacterium]|nr:dihydroorotate dehydrogenase-like protein [Acidobacteriota bacterium]